MSPAWHGLLVLRLAARGDFSDVNPVFCVCSQGDPVPGGLCHLSSIPRSPFAVVGGLPPGRDSRVAF